MHCPKNLTPRLQRVLAVLREAGGKGVTTWEIIERAKVCGSAPMRELRAMGFAVRCYFEKESNGSRVYRYVLHGEPEKD
jgi:hypothetical protein